MKVILEGNTEIRQFTVEQEGIYAWRSIYNSDKTWVFGLLIAGDWIDGQYEGFGPLTFTEVD